MDRFIVRRLVAAVPVLILITAASYLMADLLPGDPVDFLINPEVALPADVLAARRAALGLDRPLVVRYGFWMREVVRGNLGYSLVDRRPVARRIGDRLGPTLLLMGTALAIAVLVGLPLGVVSAVRRYTAVDHAATVVSLAGISLPTFFIGLALIYVLSLKVHWLPVGGMSSLGVPFGVGDRIHHLIGPAMVLGFAQAAQFARYTRASMLEVLNERYVMTARSKGLPEIAVIGRHALRPSLLPVITLLGIALPGLVSGAVVTEQIFQWPGLGTLTIDAIQSRDYPVLLAMNLSAAAAVIAGNLLADVLYAVVDPRIRYE